MNSLIVQSHRGGGALTPENTLESFLTTWKTGAIPEADLRTTIDNVIVAFHDANFARVVKNLTPEMREKGVQDVTWDELVKLDVGATQGENFVGQRVCRVEEIFGVLREHPAWAIYLDIKNVHLAQLANIAGEYGVEKQVILAAPKEQMLREWMDLVPAGQTLLWMGIRKTGNEETLRNRLAGLRAENFVGLTQLQIHVEATRSGDSWDFRPSLPFLREAAIQLKECGVLFQSLPWDCAEVEVYRALLEAGVGSFASDYPEVALRVLREWHQIQPLPLEEALKSAGETKALTTKALRVGENVLLETAQVFREQFGSQAAIVVTDAMTFELAGHEVIESFQHENQPIVSPFLFSHPALHAEFGFVTKLETALRQNEAVPVAVGSGVINDLVKLAAHRVGRPYLCVATAASMDGYTAFGASITREGSKQTFTCPAPVAVVADLKILSKAPRAMTASGYADLLAKVPAGADWLVANALQVEPIDPTAWHIVQGNLHEALNDPQGVSNGEIGAIRHLTEGLMMSGFAMQWSESTRPASGAEHQFSHLWDMQHHTHEGVAPSHGFKVGIGCLAVTALYEYLLKQPLEELDVDKCCAQWPNKSQIAMKARELLGEELSDLGQRETEAKFIEHEELGAQLKLLKKRWPTLRENLRKQIIPFAQIQERLRIVGAPWEPEQIGISRTRLRQSFSQAALIRRRFTVLDLALRTATLDAAMENIFGPEGHWPEN